MLDTVHRANPVLVPGERHFGVLEGMRALLFNSECLSRRLLIPAWSQDPPWMYVCARAHAHTRMSWGEMSVLSQRGVGVLGPDKALGFLGGGCWF